MIKHISIAMRSAARKTLGPAVLALSTMWVTGALAAADPVGSPAAATSSSASSLTAKGIDAILGNSKAKTGGDDFLQPDEAFRFAAIPDGADHVKLIWQIAEGYYLYRARIKVATTSDQAQLGALEMPPGETKTDEYFGKQEIYHHELVAGVPVARASAAALSVPLKVVYQGCATAGLCYPPITKEINVSLPPGSGSSPTAITDVGQPTATAASTVGGNTGTTAASTPHVSKQDWFASQIREGSLWIVLALFYVTGLGLAFTPCVLPMIPILTSIIVGQGKNITPRRGFSLSLAYVLGMSVTYTIGGALCAAAGEQVQTLFQQTWILLLFAGVFVAMALSLFGLFTVQMPSGIQTRIANLSNQQSAGTFGGVAVMGILSALIVTTCVAPALVGVLLVIAQTGEVARGAAALFAMSIGMGTPLLIVGASAGTLLPKVGAWMDTVKKLFGVVMLLMADWMLARVVPDRTALALWGVPALICTFVLWTEARKFSPTAAWNARILASAIALYGIALIGGAAHGGTDPFAPFTTVAVAKAEELPFRPIKSVADLQREINQAKSEGRTVLVDFSAKWCVSCKEMEKYTFTDSAVKTALDRTVLLRADVTDNDADDQALLKHMGIIGPPTIAFYGLNGQERANYRVVGFMKAQEFASHAREALGG